MVKRPEEYLWTSYHSNAWGDESWLVPHEEYKKLGANSESRRRNYRALFKYSIDANDIDLIRKAAHYCQPVGDERFKIEIEIEKKYGITVGQARRGRPKLIS